jgi:hypothetical protein
MLELPSCAVTGLVLCVSPSDANSQYVRAFVTYLLAAAPLLALLFLRLHRRVRPEEVAQQPADYLQGGKHKHTGSSQHYALRGTGVWGTCRGLGSCGCFDTRYREGGCLPACSTAKGAPAGMHADMHGTGLP